MNDSERAFPFRTERMIWSCLSLYIRGETPLSMEMEGAFIWPFKAFYHRFVLKFNMTVEMHRNRNSFNPIGEKKGKEPVVER